MAINRAEAIARMRSYYREGESFATFFKEQQRLELPTYRRQSMLNDWRSVTQLEEKAERFRYVRKDYYPTAKTMASVDWSLSQEYMYKVKVQSRISPDAPLLDRFVNIMSDTPMTRGMVEQATIEKWVSWEKYQTELIETVVPITAVHRTIE